MLRLARVLKLVRALPQLQIIVQALFDGLSSIFYILLLLLLLFYFYAIFGMLLFRRNDPLHWETLVQVRPRARARARARVRPSPLHWETLVQVQP